MTPSTPRFRFRAPNGTEEVVASVAELAERIVAGEIRVDTPLYDAGTGLWNPAGTVPVFQFVVEELREEGRLSPGAEEALEGPDPDEETAPDTPGDLPLTPDPFELHLPLRSTIPGTEGAPEDSDEDRDPEGEGAGPAEWAPEFLDDFEGEPDAGEGEVEELEGITWGVPLPARTPEPRDDPPPEPEPESEPDEIDEPEPPPFPVPPKRFPRPARRDLAAAPGEEGPAPPREGREDPWGSAGKRESDREPERESDPDAPVAPEEAGPHGRARPRPEAAVPVPPTRDRRRAVLVGTGALLAALVAVGLLLSPDRSPEPADLPPVSAPGTPPPSPDPAAPQAPPTELETEAARVLAALPAELDRWTDSLRAEVGLEPGPPREWLGGFYLSHAGDFPSVPAFWQRYRDFLLELQDGDREMYRGAVRQILGEDPDAGPGSEAVLGYFDQRYAAVGARREERYAQLVRVSEAAEALHQFLVEAQDRILHAPALGPGISADPILEAVPQDPGTRARLDELLDLLFQALDRSRGGGAPSFEGLRSELYGRFGAPV